MEQFECPILKSQMVDPVIAEDGYTYERKAIIDWIENHAGTSPMNPSQELTVEGLRLNRTLRDAIEEYNNKSIVQQQPIHSEPIDIEMDQHNEHNADSLEVQVCQDESSLLISIASPSIGNRSPVDICCVIDVSGSMNTEVTIQADDKGTVERNGLSRLDLVKHALRTVVHSLNDKDRLSLVSFETTAKRVLDLCTMDQENKQLALDAINLLSPSGSTNLWQGLKTAWDTLTNGQVSDRNNTSILLLTDGCPTEAPPRGHLPTLKQYQQMNPLVCTIHTFGFGYDLDSQLLEDIAIAGNGAFSFIPDASLVGTVFVNGLAQLLSTAATDVQLAIQLEDKDPNALNFDGLDCNNNGEWTMKLPPLLYGQSKDLLIQKRNGQDVKGQVKVRFVNQINNGQQQQEVIQLIDVNKSPMDETRLAQHKARLLFITLCRKLLVMYPDAMDSAVQQLIQSLQTVHQHYPSPLIQGLLTDAQGEIAKAVSRHSWYERWGKHYLRSLSRANLLQICNNFKDASVQTYGTGKLFEHNRNELDQIFINLPAPTPSLLQSNNNYNNYSRSINMSRYYNSAGGCFAAGSRVLMHDGTTTLSIDQLKPGQRVYNKHDKTNGSRVKYVIQMQCTDHKIQLTTLTNRQNGQTIRLTPYHPVYLRNKWQFPCNLVGSQTAVFNESYVYNLVLEQNHVVPVDSFDCLTLGHDIHNDPVARHAYFGSSRILDDLKRIDQQQQQNGMLILKQENFIRDPTSQRVVRIQVQF